MNCRLVSSVKARFGSWSGVAMASLNFFWSSIELPWDAMLTFTFDCDAL